MEILQIDCSLIEGSRRYCSPEAADIIAGMVDGCFGGLHYLGSGDFHYITKIICDFIPEPFDLLLFDHHPDMQEPAFGGILSCGGWVRDMLEGNSRLGNVTIVGIDPSLKEETGGFPGRVRVFCEGDTVVPVEGDRPVYVSVDKDVFCPCFARTNWGQGSLTMPIFGEILAMLLKGRRVLGADICGSLPISDGGTPEDCAINRDADEDIALELSRYL